MKHSSTALHFLGLDIGSSSIKLTVLNDETGHQEHTLQVPATEFTLSSPKPGWAEQAPEMWWQAVCHGIQQLLHINPTLKTSIKAIGIAYQMHGLVAVDHDQHPVRPAIIWCDSRAVNTGAQAAQALGVPWCLTNLLNTPGNFTAAKLKWVADNEPDVFARIAKVMLPGDYIAMKLTGEINTTASGLSEGTLWNFQQNRMATELLDHFHIDTGLIPDLVPGRGVAGELSHQAARQTGLRAGTKIAYRSGDQPNNAFTLNVLEAGEVAATAGTSGVIYAVTNQLTTDPKQRINSFLHGDFSPDDPSIHIGLLACINGAGRANSWLRNLFCTLAPDLSYDQLNIIARQAPPGCDKLNIYPFGNGAERIFNNALIGGHFESLDFNRHKLSHIARAVQEGIAFAMASGLNVLREVGAECDVMRVGAANMFHSELFTQALVNTTGVAVQIYNTEGAEGAARGAAWGSGYYKNRAETFQNLQVVKTIEPDKNLSEIYTQKFSIWQAGLNQLLQKLPKQTQ